MSGYLALTAVEVSNFHRFNIGITSAAGAAGAAAAGAALAATPRCRELGRCPGDQRWKDVHKKHQNKPFEPLEFTMYQT